MLSPLSQVKALVMKLVRSFPHFPRDFWAELTRDFPAFHSDHNFSAWEIVKDVNKSKSSNCLPRKIKWPIEENANIPVAAVNFYLVLLAELAELYRLNVFRRFLIVQK